MNTKQCIRGNEPEAFFYDEFSKIAEREYTIEQWRRRKIISITPETLAYPELFESAQRLYNIGIEFTCSFSRDQEDIAKHAANIFTTLAIGASTRAVWPHNHASGVSFLNQQVGEARVVVEYNRKELSIADTGEIKINQLSIPTEAPDGLSLRGKVAQTYLRSGGNPEGYLRTF